MDTNQNSPPPARRIDPVRAPEPTAWNPFAYALGELPLAAQVQFEEQMAADPQCCEDFLAALKMLNALRASRLTPPTVTSLANPRRQVRIFPAITAITAVATAALAACLIRSTVNPSVDSLHDAVALSTLLQLPESSVEDHQEPLSLADPVVENLETPDWLLTAVDLDEQSSNSDTPSSDDDEEAIF